MSRTLPYKGLRKALLLVSTSVLACFGGACEGAYDPALRISGGCQVPGAAIADTASAPDLCFFFDDGHGNAVEFSGANAPEFSAGIAGCGPFGVWEAGNGGETATEIEIKSGAARRPNVFSVSDGIVVEIQKAQASDVVGEVEGIWVKYGTATLLKYVHVVDPEVAVGQRVYPGTRLGGQLNLTKTLPTTYLWELEVRRKVVGGTVSVPFTDFLRSDQRAVFLTLFGQGKCTTLGPSEQAANWCKPGVAELVVQFPHACLN